LMDSSMPSATAAQKVGKEQWRRYRNSETMQTVMDRAERRSSQYSNAGKDNALRVEFKQLADNPRRMRYFNDEEAAAINEVANGTATQKGLRKIGQLFSPHSVGGLIGSALVGAAGHDPTLAMVAAGVGAGGKLVSTAMRKSAAQRAMDTVALGRAPVSRLGLSGIPQSGILPLLPLSEVYGQR
jgi:hypothetical protein